MANKAAIDFGNSNTVIAVWNEAAQCPEVLHVPEYCVPGSFLIPSLIAYEPDGRFFIGSQITGKASAEAREFRWMKRYINLRSPYALRIGDKRIDAKRASEDFLDTLTASVFLKTYGQPDELIISVPVESFEHYSNWLLLDMKRFENLHLRLIDEASAAAAGYGLNLHPGDSLLVLDFGGSTLQAVCVSVAEESTKEGRCCRMLGKSGCSLGGMTLDRWIFTYALDRLGLSENDKNVNHCSGQLLRYCEQVKMILSEKECVNFDFFPGSTFLMTRDDLDRLFRDHGLYISLDSVLEEALRTAEDHGLSRGELTAVLPVGGSCLIPAVRKQLETKFPAEKIVWGEPLGAVARGAAVIAGGMHIYDFIQHSYAIRYTDPRTGEYAFQTIVPKGTNYPAKQVTKKMKLKASYDGQKLYGIAIYELPENSVQQERKNEIFFDTDGTVHVLPLTEEEKRSEQRFWMNEKNPLFLATAQETEKGVPCFEIDFGIDANKMLTINVLDLGTNHQIFNAHPVVRLT